MGGWECSECGHSNAPTDTHCQLCEAPGPKVPDDRRPPPRYESPPSYPAPPERPAGYGSPAAVEFGDDDPAPVRARRVPRTPPVRAGTARLTFVAVGVLVLLLTAGVAYGLTRADGPDPALPAPTGDVVTATTAPPDPATAPPDPVDETTYVPPPPEPPAAEPLPAQVGLVTVVPGLADARAMEVAAMFDAHFGAINAGDYGAAAAYFDPDGVVDPGDPDQVATFAEDVSTTNDSDLVLHGLTDGPQPGRVLAHLTFRSQQAPGMGPRDRPAETCTRWDIVYELSTTAGYRIVRGSQAQSTPC